MHKPDVVSPYGPFLDIAIEMWEYGYRREIPPEWKAITELLRCRKLPDYQRIIKAEESVGKYTKRYAKRDAGIEDDSDEYVPKERGAKVAKLMYKPPPKTDKKQGSYEVVFEK
jgi:hypothetical protein